MSPSSVVAIVAVSNQAATIRSVISRLVDSGIFSDVVVVCDGSTDQTVDEAWAGGASHVHHFSSTQGTGAAWVYGVSRTMAQTLFLVDAQIGALETATLLRMIEPVRTRAVAMTIGACVGSPRTISRRVFDEIPDRVMHRLGVAALMAHCRTQRLPCTRVSIS